ncbi:MAG TPA: hypothetical protein VME66_04945 [Candidatus Acidoferrales bacterium]|nr:hypothetical protein [Candidatus Acidoferrales bacterium]
MYRDIAHAPIPNPNDPVTIPVSAGVPGGVRVALFSCVGLVILILGLVIVASAANHVWPASDSLKVPLS